MPNENENLDEQNAASGTASMESAPASADPSPAAAAGTVEPPAPATPDKKGSTKAPATAAAKKDPEVKLTRKGVYVFRKESEIEPLLAVGWKIAER